MKKLWVAVSLLLSACGYHLVGHGDSGVIPADADQVMIVLVGRDDALLQPSFKQALKQSEGLPIVSAEQATADVVEVHLENISEQLVATAFDTSGIANQYRLSLSAAVRVLQSGKEIWASGNMTVSADVFATGGSAEIEAQKVSVAKSLREEWVRKAVARLRSGF